MEPWEVDDLKEIAKLGFGKLGISIEDSIAENPPIMKLEFEDVKERIYRLLADDCKRPSPQMIRESLAKLKELLYERENIFKVLDWKEGSLYILDPLFLFYLRWGGAH